MNTLKESVLTASHTNPILLYDGDCILCSGFVKWLIRQDKKDQFKFCTLQEGRIKPDAEIDTVLLINNGQSFEKSDVTFQILKTLGGKWSLLSIFSFVPRFIRDSIYTLIVNNRYSLFGKEESCLIMTDEIRGKFIEA